jgi:TonB-linked SusC/RagA family outer membrane protein
MKLSLQAPLKGRRRKVVCAPLLIAMLLPGAGYAVESNLSKRAPEVKVSSRFVNVTGTVTDNKGEPLPGVSIKIKGTNTATISDVNGGFRLNLPTGNETLVFSFLGFKTLEVPAAGRNNLTITLEDEISNLEEVVVIGYGTVKKKDLTGAVASVKAEEIMRTPTANVMDAMQSKVSGMEIMKSSGRAGAGVNVSIRGQRSISGNSTPLYIIDGIPGDFSQLNPSDIETIDVAKDASATAIYGSAGANGVVFITTKKGKEGRTTVAFDSYFGYNGFPRYPHGLTGDAYVNLKKEAYRTQRGNYPEFMSEIFTDPVHLGAYEAGQWVDWVDLALKDGLQQNYSLSVNGGTEKTTAYLSVNYNKEEGLIANEDFTKYAVRTNIDHTVSNAIKIGSNIQFTNTANNQGAQNIFGNSLTTLPLGQPFNEDGSVRYVPINGILNPLSDQIQNQYVNNTINNYFAGNGYVDIKPLKGLSFRSIIGATLSSSRNGKFFGPQSIANVEAGFVAPAAVIDNGRTTNYRWENILGYEFDINNDHKFNLTGVTSWAKNQFESSFAGGSGFDLDSYSFYNLSAATSRQTIRSSFSRSQSLSYVGRLNYSFKGKYLATFSNRWDGVSHLSDGNKWDMFPAASLAWRISEESFLKDINAVSDLKLRLGYGVTGNSGGIGAYGIQSGGFNAPQAVGFGDNRAPSFIINTNMANASLGWEKSYTTNIGVDAELFRGLINLTVDAYNTDTKDILLHRTIPASLGGSWGSPFKMWQNLGETNNKGVEVLLTSRNINRNDFTWSTTVTFSATKEKVTKLPGDQDLISDRLFLGHPIRPFYDFKYLGIWQENELDEAAIYNSLPGGLKLATDGTFNADGKHAYNNNDRRILGSLVPSWSGGLQNNFTYKNWDASVFLTARWGQMIESNLITRYNPIFNAINSPDDLDYWTPENPGAYLPRPGLYPATSGYIGFNALKFVDGSYFKIRNITLGYSLPANLAKKVAMQRLRVYATANNPFIFTKSSLLKYQDPEGNGSDNFPLTKQFVVGLNVTF